MVLLPLLHQIPRKLNADTEHIFFNLKTREPMHNLLLYLQFNPGSAATLPGIPPPNFCKQDLASLPTKSASNSKQMIWVHLGIPVKHSSKEKKSFAQHSSKAKKCQQDAPVKIKGH